MRILFWFASALVAWTYIGFPAVAVLRARWRPRPVRAADVTPAVTVVLAAHDEAAAIGERVTDLLRQDYPPDRYRIVVASDGSTDDTVAEARRTGDARVEVLDLPRVGKAAALNAAVSHATGDLLVFTDANTSFAADAIRRLVRPFADPAVGGVAGDQVYLRPGSDDDAAANVGERGYWDLDRMVKLAESLGGSVISATGAIYAIRRELFVAVPECVTDDFVTSTRVVEQGHRLVFEPTARAFEPTAGSGSREYRRKVRIMTRGLRGVGAVRSLLDPRRSGFYAIQLLTHKVLRRVMVVPLGAIAIASLTLWPEGIVYRIAALGQLAVYGLGLAGLAARDRPVGRRPMLALPAFFCLVNIASLHAIANLVTGRRIDRWTPARGSDPPDADPPGSTR